MPRARLATAALAAAILTASSFQPAAAVSSGRVRSIQTLRLEEHITFVDAAGRTVHLPRPPRRIVVLAPASYIIGHLMYMFPKGRERLVGMERRGSTASDFLPLIDPDFEKKAFLDPNPGPEQIARLKPELVLLRGRAVDKKTDALEFVGIRVAYLGLEKPEEYGRDLANLGLILDNPERAVELAAFFRARLDRVVHGVAAIPAEARPRVLLAMAISRGGRVAVEVPALPWMQTLQLKAAGGRAIWESAADKTSGWTIVNLEQIASWNPETIILVVWHSLDTKKTVLEFKSDSRWAALKAVKEDRFYVFPADLYGWDTPDPRWILGLLWLAKKIHPESFRDLDLDLEVEEFYRVLYGMDKAAVAAKIRPTFNTDIR